MPRVGALLVDYDGTIAPLGVPREESRIFRSVERELEAMVNTVPVCIVTAKDFDFVRPRSKFAAAWACVSGLDIVLADGRRFTRRRLADLTAALKVAEWAEGLGSFTELKRGPSGELLAVGVDWSAAPEAGAVILPRLKALGARNFVSRDAYSTFADVYAARPDKGRATKFLKRILGGRKKVMFIGDSAHDNAAFQEAGIAVGVEHGQPMDDLRCSFVVEQTRLGGFLRSLRGRGMEFTPSMPWVERLGEK